MNKQKILISVINNTGQWPTYFCLDLINLLEKTKEVYPNTKLQTIRACSVNEMRNFSCRNAMGKRGAPGEESLIRVDYLVQLDTDHRYSPTFIIDLMKHDKDVITGCTSSRHSPFQQTQFKKFQYEMRGEDNLVNPSPEDPLMTIEASGPVGMIVKVDVLDKLKYPYYTIKHIGDKGGFAVESIQGGDIYFCEKLKEAGIEIWLDPKVTFPHEVNGVFVNRGNISL